MAVESAAASNKAMGPPVRPENRNRLCSREFSTLGPS
jgi:hypothetical protein